MTPPLVIYVMSTSRSGSTALTLSLGSYEGVFAGGEFRNLVRSGLLEGGLCGCGTPARECDFWASVVAGASSRLQNGFRCPQLQVDAQLTSSRMRHFSRVLRNDIKFVTRQEHVRHREFMHDLYVGAAAVARCPILIDSSKHPVGAAELRLMTDIPAFFIHLVRDPRGVCYSVQRPKRQLGDPSGRFMPTASVGRSAILWDVINVQSELLRRRVAADRFLRVRYEDLADDPTTGLKRIWSAIVDSGLLPVEPPGRSEVAPNHTAWGNPMRMGATHVDWRVDDRWRAGMSARDRRLVSALTMPLRRRYRYVS